ncbi:MAG: glycerate kinase [Bacteroidota bacterium]
MKVLIAPDKFKESLSAIEVGKAIAKGIQEQYPNAECIIHPLADGGDGSISVLSSYFDFEQVEIAAQNPLGKKINIHYYIADNTAFIELASASGIVLLNKEERNPRKTSSLGTGEMIADALSRGLKKIFLFLGGSVTNDVGIGIAHALGFRFLDEQGNELYPCGENLIRIQKIDTSNLQFPPENIDLTCLCDVQSLLYGKNGATHIYAAQKGASETDIEYLEKGVQHFSNIIKQQLNIDLQSVTGGGASGGIAAGLLGLLGAKAQSGIETILKLTNFEEQLIATNWVISGEGKLDAQTLEGKAVSGVSTLAKKYKKPFTVFVGQHELTKQQQKTLGIEQIFAVMDKAEDLEDALQNAEQYLKELAYDASISHTKSRI